MSPMGNSAVGRADAAEAKASGRKTGCILMSRVPAYSVVYQTIKQRIRDGYYPVGSLLPTETELEKEFSVSRTTIRRATSILSSEGYIRVVQGKGSEVLSSTTTQRLNSISSITETLRMRGFEVSTQGMCIDRVPAPPQVAEALELGEGQAVYLVQRVQCVDGTPFAIMNNYLKADMVPGLEQYGDQFVSLYRFLEDHYHLTFHHAMEYLSASAADFMEAMVLHIAVGTPLLCSRRVTSGDQGLFEYGVTKILAERYEYCVYLEGR